MLGYRLFRHAVLMLIDNLVTAIRISAVPLLLPVAFAFAVVVVMLPRIGTAPIGLLGLLGALLYVGTLAWVAVGWHRFVLLQEQPGAAWPHWHGGRVWSYAKALLRILPLLLVLGIAMAFLAVILGMMVGQARVATTDGTILGFLLGAAMSYATLRLCLVLPAAAIGDFMRVPESWRRTAPYSGAVFVAALCVSFLALIPQLLLLTPLAPLATGFAYVLLANWLLTMLGISIATALYGHIVQQRPLR